MGFYGLGLSPFSAKIAVGLILMKENI